MGVLLGTTFHRLALNSWSSSDSKVTGAPLLQLGQEPE